MEKTHYNRNKGIATALHLLSIVLIAVCGAAVIGVMEVVSGTTDPLQLQADAEALRGMSLVSVLSSGFSLALYAYLHLKWLIAGAVVGAVLWIGSLIAMLQLAGHRDGQDGICLRFYDRWYLEPFLIGGGILLFVLAQALFENLFDSSGEAALAGTAVVLYPAALVILLSLVRRGKAGTFFSGTLIAACVRGIRRAAAAAESWGTDARQGERRITKAFLLYLAANLTWLLLGILLIRLFRREPVTVVVLILLFAAGWIWGQRRVLRTLRKKTAQQQAVTEAMRDIRAGDLSRQVASDGFLPQEAEMAEAVNHIGEGLRSAVEDATRSERMKAELITNVSHDLKTPLTSIINYVELLKRKEMPDEEAARYVDVLAQKSERLKILVEDLVEASRASSGNVKLEMMPLDLAELVCQVQGEYEERFEGRGLTPVVRIEDGGVPVCADGRRLWRVLSNLYGNAVKYSMPGTRVYIDLARNGTQAVFSMKNISEAPLSVPPEELTERFTRGDEARSTEGSGLGLAIAKDLTELMNGTLTIRVDGDLFSAILRLPLRAGNAEQADEPAAAAVQSGQ